MTCEVQGSKFAAISAEDGALAKSCPSFTVLPLLSATFSIPKRVTRELNGGIPEDRIQFFMKGIPGLIHACLPFRRTSLCRGDFGCALRLIF